MKICPTGYKFHIYATGIKDIFSCGVRISSFVQKKTHKINKIVNAVVLSGQNPRFQVKFSPAELAMAVLFS